MAKETTSPYEIGIKRRGYFWLGVALMIFGGIINTILIVVFEIYPMLSIGIIISLFSFAFGFLSAIRSIMPFNDNMDDAVTKVDVLLMFLTVAIIIISLILVILAEVTWWAFFLHLVIGVALIIGFLGIEGKGVTPTTTKAIILSITITVLFGIVIVGFFLWGATILDLLFGIFLIAFGVSYMALQFRETPKEKEWEVGFSQIVKETDGNPMSNSVLKFLMLVLTHVASAIIIGVGINLIIVSTMFELLLLGYIFTGIGLALLVLSVVYDGIILYRLITVPDSDARSRLGLILLLVGIGVAVAAFVGYLLFYFVL